MYLFYADDVLIAAIPSVDDYDPPLYIKTHCKHCGALIQIGQTHCEYCKCQRELKKEIYGG